MFSHVEQALEHLNKALDGIDTAPCDLLRRTLGLSKQLRSRVELLETRTAAVVAQQESHGDGGAGLLREHSGLSRSDAARNVRTDTELASIPDAQAAVTDGHISLANAAKLAQAARKTSSDAVQGDPELIGLAKTLPADDFALAAQRWTARHQDAADLAAQHRRNRRNRNVRFWNGDDGSVQMRGSFDAEMGARIQERLRRQAEQFRQADRRRQNSPQDPSGRTADAADAAVRTRDQRMADALDTLLANGTTAGTDTAGVNTAGTDTAGTDTAGVDTAGVDTAGVDTAGVDTAGVDTAGVDTAGVDTAGVDTAGVDTAGTDTAGTDTAGTDTAGTDTVAPAHNGRKMAAAEIIVRADLPALAGEPGGVAEISGVGPIPPSSLERLACNSDVWLEIFGDKLTPLYEAVAHRAPTSAQRRALIARDGACIGCGTAPGECEAHHVIPWKCGGKTRVDNLVLVCWSCHDRIHDHNWQVIVRDGRFRLIPPDPSRPPNPAPSRKPKRRAPHKPQPAVMSHEPPPSIAPHQLPLRVTPQMPLPPTARRQPLSAATPKPTQPAAQEAEPVGEAVA